MSPRLVAFLPLAVALNVATGYLVNQLGLPVYLDTLGTLVATVLAGPGAGLAVGAVSQLVVSLQVGAFMLAFTPVQGVIVACVALAARGGGFATATRAGLSGALAGLACGLVSSVISYAAFKGVTAFGVSALGAALRAAGLTLEQAVVAASVATDMLDKALVFLVAGAALRGLPRRAAARYPLALRAVRQ